MRNFIERLEKYFRGRFLTVIYFKLLKWFSECKECYDGYFYPQYGVAPHTHVFKKEYLENFIGSTRIRPKPEWPDNYDDVDDGCGVYYCPNPNCKNNISNKTEKKIIPEIQKFIDDSSF